MNTAEIIYKIDPNEEKGGYYELLALDILLTSTNMSPIGLITRLNTYGFWNMNHYESMIE
nr:hypothetical protein [Leptospira interrogans]